MGTTDTGEPTALPRRRGTGLVLLAVVVVVVTIVGVATALSVSRGSSHAGARSGGAEASGRPASAGSLAGVDWLLTGWSPGGGTVGQPAEGRRIGVEFSSTQIDAYDGCNGLFGTVAFTGSSFTVESGGVTQVGCDFGGFQDDFWAVLESPSVETAVTADTLTLSAPGHRLIFTRGPKVELSLTPTTYPPTATPVSWTSQLVGPVWQLATITSGGVTWKAPEGAGSLSFQNNHWAATDGCNEHWGSISYGNASRHQGFPAVEGPLTFGSGPQTAALCTEPVVTRVQTLIREKLTGTVAARLDAGTLTLNVPDAVVTFRTSTGPAASPGFADSLSFTPSAPPPSASVAPIATIGASAIRDALTKNPWRLTSVSDATGVLPVTAAQGAGLTMTADTYVATDGCNRYTGAIAYTDVKVSTGPPASTKKPCPSVASRIGADFVAVLTGPIRFEFEGNGSITATSGQTVLAFARG